MDVCGCERWPVLSELRQYAAHTLIDFLEFSTGKRSPIVKLDKPAWLGLALSPDEKYLLYSVVDSEKSNLMLVDKLQ